MLLSTVGEEGETGPAIWTEMRMVRVHDIAAILVALSCNFGDAQMKCTPESSQAMGNGQCDPIPNRTSDDSGHDSLSGCLDPMCTDLVASEFSSCTGDIGRICNGVCDQDGNNYEVCGYDGGDCCFCSCSAGECRNFNCVDPNTADEAYNCRPPPRRALPCHAGVQRVWEINTTAQAQALADAVICSGGNFEVQWKGHVDVEQTIQVVDGTSLRISGVGPGAVLNGNSNTRLFSAVNAFLHLSGVTVSHGVGASGGAIAATSSTVTLDSTTFVGNRADQTGGAVFLANSSELFCVGRVLFSDNSAGGDGGAWHVSSGSSASCSGETLFFSNAADDDGGAVMVDDGSSISWSGKTVFVGNLALDDGGALMADESSKISWNWDTTLTDNVAKGPEGATTAVHGSIVSGIRRLE